MTNLLLKTKTELFKWLRERERDGLRLRRGILRSCRDLYSFPCFNSKFTELIVNRLHSRLLPEHVNMFIEYIFIYEIGYCYEDRR